MTASRRRVELAVAALAAPAAAMALTAVIWGAVDWVGVAISLVISAAAVSGVRRRRG